MLNELTNLNKPFGEVLEKYFSRASPAYVVAPFININALERILLNVDDAMILTSWRPDHLVSGYSTLDLYKACKEKGWTLFINDRLHAKIYSNTLLHCFLGSSNVTEAALYSNPGNIECMTYIGDIGTKGRIEINRLFALSTLVDDRIYNQYLRWYESLDQSVDLDEIKGPRIDDLSPYYISQLPATDDPHTLYDCIENRVSFDSSIEHDFAIYGVMDFDQSQDLFMEQLSSNFFNHPFIKLFEQRVKEKPIYFGEAKLWVQENCVNVPLPHRKDLTALVHNLFYWFKHKFPSKCTIHNC